MREGWKYIQLTKVSDIKAGFTPSSNELSPSGDIPYFKVGDMNTLGNEMYLMRTESYLCSSSKIFPKGAIVFPKNGAAIGTNKKRILAQNSVVDLNTAVLIPHKNFMSEFLYYWIQHIDFREITRRGAIPTLDIQELKSACVPNISRSEQERIVAELDLLTGIIDKQKAQLKELDTLAQSIFYDMFGDTDANNKKWDKVSVGENFEYIKNGANIKQTRGAGGLPITRIETLSGGVFNRDRLGYANVIDDKKYSKYILDDNDILMSHINSKAYIGRSVVYKKQDDEIIIHGMNLLRLKPIMSKLDSIYAKFFFDTFYFKKQVASIRKDAVNQSSIAVSDIVKLQMLLPPLTLQREFNKKVDEIEENKSIINRSIAETQKLFDYTMDKYFG